MSIPDKPELAVEAPLEGGEVKLLEDYPIAERHRAETARYLAYTLVSILGLTVLLQYGLTVLLVCLGKTEGIANLDKIFNILLPVLSGLVSGAATYYFTKDKQ